jgi:tetratricopeptide (TPR) repeat protein
LYTGNAPGADVRGTQRPPGSTGGVSTQQSDATRMANLLSGLEMDPVEADQWWARRAIEARLDDPIGTLKLLARRATLLISNSELSLAMAPAMDTNPLRWLAPFPICLLIGLAVGGVAGLGWRRTGGWPVWLAILACAAMPLIFYVTSRYRLPMVALLCLPAGVGLNALATGAEDVGLSRKRLGLLLGAAAAIASIVIPVGEMKTGEVTSLLERASAWRKQGDLINAEADLRRALDRHPDATSAWVQLADLQRVDGRPGDAEQSFRRALVIDPGSADAAGGLGGLLLGVGRAGEAVPLLEHFLGANPLHAAGWNSLVLALWNSGQQDEARQAVQQASERGVRLEKKLLDAMEGSPRPAE